MYPMVGEITKIIVSNLAQMTREEFHLIRHFNNDCEELRNRANEMEQFLAYAESRDVNDPSIKHWLKKLEDVAQEAYYFLDEIKYEHRRRNITSQMRLPLRLRFSSRKRLTFRCKMGHKIKKINLKFKEIDDYAARNGYKTGLNQAARALPLLEETDGITVDPIVVGRESDISELVEKITTTNDHLSVVSICGMGGIGKTTLARLVFNHHDTKKHFDERIWMCVSGNFDAVTLFKRMLKSETLLEHSTRQDVLEKLQEKMNGKRYLLILDDLWNESWADSIDFENTLRGVNSYRGNVIIITTRSDNVAWTVDPSMGPHRLSFLTDDECWSIIKARAYKNEQELEQLRAIGKEIASQCVGIPLMATMIGGTLRGKGRDEWMSIRDALLSDATTDSIVLHILKVSYDRLANPSLKKCFAYCSLFSKDTFIDRESVIQQWMGAGFLDKKITGNTYFQILLQNYFFQEAKKDEYGNIEGCKMHDLVHDLACFISGSESLVMHPGNICYSIPRYRYLAFRSLPNAVSKMITITKAKHLHTLILEGTNATGFEKILPHLKKLHVLLLINVGMEDCPTSIGKLIHLRYLDMSQNKIRNLPSTICKLYNLQTLIITGCGIYELPDGLQHLTDLRHLEFDVWRRDLKLPPNINRLASLRTLPVFNVSDKKGCGIDELGDLKDLGGELTIHGLELVKSKAEAERADLVSKYRICKLVFVWGETKSDSVTNSDDKHVLEGLQPHPNIKGITIRGFKGQRFPSWTMEMAIHEDRGPRLLDNLIEVTLSNCSECEEIPAFGHLPNLKHLKLENLGSVRSIGPSFYGSINDSSSTCSEKVFPALETLKLMKLPKLEEWMEVPVTNSGLEIFPRLKHLDIRDCPMLTTAPSHFPCLEDLPTENIQLFESLFTSLARRE